MGHDSAWVFIQEQAKSLPHEMNLKRQWEIKQSLCDYPPCVMIVGPTSQNEKKDNNNKQTHLTRNWVYIQHVI